MDKKFGEKMLYLDNLNNDSTPAYLIIIQL